MSGHAGHVDDHRLARAERLAVGSLDEQVRETLHNSDRSSGVHVHESQEAFRVGIEH
jgi:hypothetical protein